MIEHRASLLKDMKFEGGLELKQGTPIFVTETKHGAIGSFYPDPLSHTSHSFALMPGDFSLWVNGKTQEPYLVIAEEDPPDPEEIERLREMKHKQAQKTIDYLMKRLGEAQEELEATRATS